VNATLMRGAIVASARASVNCRYKHQGRHREDGLDCAGVLILALRESEYSLRDADAVNTHNYAPRAEDDTFLRTVQGECDEIPLGEAMAGDLLAFWFPEQKFPHHIAIVSRVLDGVHYFIHAYNGDDVSHVVEDGLKDLWRDRFYKAYRLKGLVET